MRKIDEHELKREALQKEMSALSKRSNELYGEMRKLWEFTHLRERIEAAAEEHAFEVVKRPCFTVDKHLGAPQQYENVNIVNDDKRAAYLAGAEALYKIIMEGADTRRWSINYRRPAHCEDDCTEELDGPDTNGYITVVEHLVLAQAQAKIAALEQCIGDIREAAQNLGATHVRRIVELEAMLEGVKEQRFRFAVEITNLKARIKELEDACRK